MKKSVSIWDTGINPEMPVELHGLYIIMYYNKLYMMDNFGT
jgi:hypothetical protein